MDKRKSKPAITRQRNGAACYEQTQRFLRLAEDCAGSYEQQTELALRCAAHFQRISAKHYARARQIMGVSDDL